MIERQTELKRRYHRKKAMTKWKTKLVAATGEDRTRILAKIKRLSPAWNETMLRTPDAAPAAEAPAAAEPKKKPARTAKPKE